MISLAEPREHVSCREIARVCKVGGSTIKAIERAEAAAIAVRKAKMLRKVTRVAAHAWSTVKDKLDNFNLAQATICAAVATEKMILLGGDPVQMINISISALNVMQEIQAIAEEIRQARAQLPDAPTFENEVVESTLVDGNGAVDGSAAARASE